jgi:hypothetical protein
MKPTMKCNILSFIIKKNKGIINYPSI